MTGSPFLYAKFERGPAIRLLSMNGQFGPSIIEMYCVLGRLGGLTPGMTAKGPAKCPLASAGIKVMGESCWLVGTTMSLSVG